MIVNKSYCFDKIDEIDIIANQRKMSKICCARLAKHDFLTIFLLYLRRKDELK